MVSQNQLCPTLRRQKKYIPLLSGHKFGHPWNPGTQTPTLEHYRSPTHPLLCQWTQRHASPQPKTSWSQFYPGLTFLSKFANLWSHTEPNLVSNKTSNKIKSLLLYAGNALGNLDQTPDMKLRTQLQALFLEITICDINLT